MAGLTAIGHRWFLYIADIGEFKIPTSGKGGKVPRQCEKSGTLLFAIIFGRQSPLNGYQSRLKVEVERCGRSRIVFTQPVKGPLALSVLGERLEFCVNGWPRWFFIVLYIQHTTATDILQYILPVWSIKADLDIDNGSDEMGWFDVGNPSYHATNDELSHSEILELLIETGTPKNS